MQGVIIPLGKSGRPGILIIRVRDRRWRPVPAALGRDAPRVVLRVGIKGVVLLAEWVVLICVPARGATAKAACSCIAARGTVRVAIVGARAAVRGCASPVGIIVVVVVGGMYWRISLFIMGCEGECGLVRVNVLGVSLALIVAGKAVVPLVVFERPDAEESGNAEKEAMGVG